jgi:hypothetical protein
MRIETGLAAGWSIPSPISILVVRQLGLYPPVSRIAACAFCQIHRLHTDTPNPVAAVAARKTGRSVES